MRRAMSGWPTPYLLLFHLLSLCWADSLSGEWINEGRPTLATGPANAHTLQYVQVLWRHGDRTPAVLIPTDKGNDESTWPEGLGELTREGAAQQFRLGKWLRQRYTDFLGSKFLRNQMYIRSSDYNRTLMSAQSNLAGLFPPTQEEEFEKGIAWQPMPVHTVPRDMDVQLYEEIRCPAAEAEKDRVYRDFPRAKEIAEKEKPLLTFLQHATGIPLLQPMGLKEFWKVYDPLNSEFWHKDAHTWPSWMNESLWQRIITVYDDASRFSFYTKLLRRLRGGPLVHEVLDRFLDKATGKTPKAKLYAYSAHDTSLAAILATFGIFPVRFPLYATAVLIEMHRVNGEDIIEMYHKNGTDSPTLYKHELEGCPSPCKLETLRKAMEPFEPSNWRQECGLQNDEHLGRYIAAIVALSLTTLLLGTFLAVDIFLKYGRRRERSDAGRLLAGDEDEITGA